MPTKKKPAKSAKKTKLNKLSQADGKDDSKQETMVKSQARTLDQVWGDTGLSKYNTMDQSEYELRIGEMNKTDMQAHAQQIGLIPVDDVRILKQRLINEFKSHVAKYKSVDQPKQTTEVSKETLNILKEGR
tara:strand:- start:289 stop:681 length:393 start_codon:yes stop_codon:yes gene_type:complete